MKVTTSHNVINFHTKLITVAKLHRNTFASVVEDGEADTVGTALVPAATRLNPRHRCPLPCHYSHNQR